ncbi:UDP-4-amino-4,6-dideoxy-N-acetyl-beta-L-altrosamine N-acetyltransferase [Shewanella baltica]|uniref:UDP-4-amino-4, 6-dideoxy-N-acetyl-beta-L-altrosamine N-acetyltransferase n=1 Tax=Shewanella baltica TaxID=62322 RepID=UPI003D79D61C
MQLKDVLQNQFRRLSAETLEAVWRWRNLPHIRANMHTDRLISWQEHLQWFEQLQQDASRAYWVLWQNNNPVGTLYFTAVSEDMLEWGCYLGEQQLWPGSGLLLEVAALDYASQYTQATTLRAEVLSTNSSVLKMHHVFGYQEKEALKYSGTRNDIFVFEYLLTDWRQYRAMILNRLPKQITAAANLMTFDL